jgi:hypothetical protein
LSVGAEQASGLIVTNGLARYSVDFGANSKCFPRFAMDSKGDPALCLLVCGSSSCCNLLDSAVALHTHTLSRECHRQLLLVPTNVMVTIDSLARRFENVIRMLLS